MLFSRKKKERANEESRERERERDLWRKEEFGGGEKNRKTKGGMPRQLLVVRFFDFYFNFELFYWFFHGTLEKKMKSCGSPSMTHIDTRRSCLQSLSKKIIKSSFSVVVSGDIIS